MSRYYFVVLLLLGLAPPAIGQSRQPAATIPPPPSRGSSGFLIKMERSRAELIPHGTTGGLCAIIWPDGQLHAERRRQTLPSTHAAIEVYDILLSAEQMTALRQVLDTGKLIQVAPFATPRLPAQVAAYYMFTADIRRSDGLQHVGFLQFGQNGGNGDKPLVIEDARPSDRELRPVLQPLLEWMQSTVDQSDANPNGEVNFCESPQK